MEQVEQVVELYFKGFSVKEAIEKSDIDIDVFNRLIKVEDKEIK
jgi:hypothetical protein